MKRSMIVLACVLACGSFGPGPDGGLVLVNIHTYTWSGCGC